MQKLLTIVIPVYKVEEYINKCLDSLIIAPELMKKMDVLIVNDGTPDRSAEISREYVNRFPGLFRQIDKENGGHGSVWNLGLKEAKGKYVRFLDSDDWVENLDLLLDKLETCDAGLVITPTICHLSGGGRWKLIIKDMEFGKVYDADTFDWLGNRSHGNYVLHHSCTYKTEILRQLLPLFLEKQPYDDTILGVASIIGARSLVAYDFVLYHYLMDREGQSISKNVMKTSIEARIKAQKAIIAFVEEHPVDNQSSKHQFFMKKLPKMYNFGYKQLLFLPFDDSKKKVAEWDEWMSERDPGIHTDWQRLYRSIPFPLYRCIGRLCLHLLHR